MAHATDVHIGKRLREARLACGLSQDQLGKRLGVSFQQVQKYEKGTNRIGGSRLWDICRILDMPVSFFFEGLEGQAAGRKAGSGAQGSELLPNHTIRLAKEINQIDDEQVKTHFLKLVRAFTSDKSGNVSA